MAKISLLLPTRGRPHWVRRVFESLAEHTAVLDDLEVVLYVDEDDQPSHGLDHESFRVVKIIGPRASMGEYNTACLEHASGEIVILMNDDVIVRTPGWDRRVAELAAAVPDGVFLAYANDLHMGKRMCTFPICTRKACEIMVRPYPEEYRAGFIDWHLFDVFKRLKAMGHDRIFFLEKIVFEHCHYMAGKAEIDPTYRSKDYYADDWTFVALRDLRQKIAERLKASVIGQPLPELPTLPSPARRPRAAWAVLLQFASVFLLDFALPMAERVRLFVWLTGRYLRSAGYLPPKRPISNLG
jgi:glycosyltransferase involved in cell wall biosynthesis